MVRDAYLEDPIHQCLTRGWTPRHIDIDWYDSVAPSGDAVAVVIVSSSIGATAHAHNPSRVRHLIVDLPQSRSHLVRECAGNDHNVRLPWGCPENDAESILIIARG